MTTTAEAPVKPAKLSREEDPRNPVHRLAALLDEGTLQLISADDDSGMLAAVGQVGGTRVVASPSRPTWSTRGIVRLPRVPSSRRRTQRTARASSGCAASPTARARTRSSRP